MVLDELETVFSRNFLLQHLDGVVVKFDLLSTCFAEQMIMVGSSPDVLIRRSTLKVLLLKGRAANDARALQGGEIAIDGRHCDRMPPRTEKLLKPLRREMSPVIANSLQQQTSFVSEPTPGICYISTKCT